MKPLNNHLICEVKDMVFHVGLVQIYLSPYQDFIFNFLSTSNSKTSYQMINGLGLQRLIILLVVPNQLLTLIIILKLLLFIHFCSNLIPIKILTM